MNHVSVLQIQLYNKQVFWVGEPFVDPLVSQCREEEAPPHTHPPIFVRIFIDIIYSPALNRHINN